MQLSVRSYKRWNRIFRLFTIFLLFTCLCLATENVQAKTLKVLSGFPTTHLYTESCLGIFEKNLKAASGDKLNLSIMGPDVVPTNEQFQPVQSGIFDLLFTHTAYHMGTTAMGLTLEAIDPDPVKRRESGIIQAIDADYQKNGMKLLSVLPAVEYNIVLSKPVAATSPSLKGLKIRTPPAGAPMIKALGGAPVSLPPGEIYTALQKGVIDGFTLVAVGLKDYKIYEVAKYLARPKFGFISFALFMNADEYRNMTAKEREWLQTAAVESEKEAMVFFRKKHEEEVKELISLGMETIQLPPEDAARVGKLMNATIWAVTEKKSGQAVVDLHKLALEKGMTR